MPGFWDSPDVKAAASNPEYAAFKVIGDENEGTVASLTLKKSWEGTPNESTGYEIRFTDAPTVTANTRMLIQALYELQPEIGDRLYIRYLEDQRFGTKAMKRYLVRLTKQDGQAFEINQSQSGDGMIKILSDAKPSNGSVKLTVPDDAGDPPF